LTCGPQVDEGAQRFAISGQPEKYASMFVLLEQAMVEPQSLNVILAADHADFTT
jgi:hypothetical protein